MNSTEKAGYFLSFLMCKMHNYILRLESDLIVCDFLYNFIILTRIQNKSEQA